MSCRFTPACSINTFFPFNIKRKYIITFNFNFLKLVLLGSRVDTTTFPEHLIPVPSDSRGTDRVNYYFLLINCKRINPVIFNFLPCFELEHMTVFGKVNKTCYISQQYPKPDHHHLHIMGFILFR